MTTQPIGKLVTPVGASIFRYAAELGRLLFAMLAPKCCALVIAPARKDRVDRFFSPLRPLESTKFEFFINLQTARVLGIKVPPAVLSIADEVIE